MNGRDASKFHRHLPAQWLILMAGVLAISCIQPPPEVCAPGITLACTCGGGTEGVQVCAPDGRSWGACTNCFPSTTGTSTTTSTDAGREPDGPDAGDFLDGGESDAGNPLCRDPTSPACMCTVKADCGPNPTNFICTPTHQCLFVCGSSSDCPGGKVCYDAICISPGCNSDAECPSGQQCVSGQCGKRIVPIEVASCAVEPSTAVVQTGATRSFTLLARDGRHNVLPYLPQAGEVTWTVTGAAGSVAPASAFTVSVTGGPTSSTGQVKASIGSLACTPASLVNEGTPMAGTFRVIVASSADDTPIAGATVVVHDSAGAATTGQTDANGVVDLTGVAEGPASVSAFMSGYSYVTVMGLTGAEAGLFLEPLQAPGTEEGSLTAKDFAPLPNQAGTMHVAFNGPAVTGSLMDLSLSVLLGKSVPTMISLGGSTASNTSLPDGMAAGLGQQMFKGSVGVAADPGLRTVWGLAGNSLLSEWLSAVSSLSGTMISGEPFDMLAAAELPVAQSSVQVGGNFLPSSTGTLVPAYSTLTDLQTMAQVPVLPKYQIDGVATRFDGVMLFGGVRSIWQGFVPLGLTAGFDRSTGSSHDGVPDGVVDPVMPGAPPGQLPLQLAPAHDGLEGSPPFAVALAVTFSTDPHSGGLDEGREVISGLAVTPPPILFKDNATSQLTFGGHSQFMSVPDTVTFDGASRTLTISAAPAGADLERFDVADQDGAKWSVYFPPSLTSVRIPEPPAGMPDYVNPTDSATQAPYSPAETLRSASLKLNAGVTYQSVFDFSGDTADHLQADVDAFSSRRLENGQ